MIAASRIGERLTERAYILGHPISHSQSPAMHNAVYQAFGLDWEYGFADCLDEEQALAFLQRGDWRALNVTMPYKPLAYEAADERSAAAVLADAANVLVRANDGSLLADNTDGIGCVSYLQRCGVRLAGSSVVVCGTGATARAIMHAVVLAGSSHVVVAGRNAYRADEVACGYLAQLDDMAKAPMTVFAFNDAKRMSALQRAADFADVEGGSYDELYGALEAADVIVDATPLGMMSNDPAPFDTSVLHAGQTVLDVVYGHGETALLQAARKVGCAAYDGKGMLVAQAVQTVRDIEEAIGDFGIPADFDLYALMVAAADPA